MTPSAHNPHDIAARRARERRRKIKQRRFVALLVLIALVIVAIVALAPHDGGDAAKDGRGGQPQATPPDAAVYASPEPANVSLDGDGIKISTFLGTPARRFYGLGPAPKRLDLIWKTAIGSGSTSAKYPDEAAGVWSGTGWTGMPALIRDKGKLSLLIGGYDHNLHRIDAATGEVIWEYAFDDVIKGSPSVFANPAPKGEDDAYVVLAGSRRGYPLKIDSPLVAPYRAVTFGSGKELWRLPSPQTESYSRDCDASGFYLDGRQYMVLEDGWFYALDPLTTEPWKDWQQPKVLASQLLLGDKQTQRSHYDARLDASNLVIESSPTLLGDTIYIASGAGFVYGLNKNDLSVTWSYKTGSDLDGTVVPTDGGRLLLPIEKEYIKGHGGLMLLDPTKTGREAPIWYFPTGDRTYADWAGGIVGSPAVNDESNRDGTRPALTAVIGIDGYLYVISQDTLAKGKVPGPDGKQNLPTPVQVYKTWVNGGISSPIIVGDTLIAATYDEIVHMYTISYKAAKEGQSGALPSRDGNWWKVSLKQTASFTGGGSYESTPVLWDGRVYIGSRDGYFYCLGER